MHDRAPTPDIFGGSQRSALTGTVIDRSGEPQAGAHVALLNRHKVVVAETFTDARGRYRLPRLNAGVYGIEVSSAMYLPAMQQNLRLMADSRLVVNLTLSTLYDVMQWLPAEPAAANGSRNDWSWTLRLSTNRPLLRMLDPDEARKLDAAIATDGEGGKQHTRRTQVAVHSGLARFGEGGIDQDVAWTNGGGSSRALLLSAQTAMASGTMGRLMTSGGYTQSLSPERTVTTIVTMSDRPDIAGGLSTVRMRSSTTMRMGDLADFDGGTEFVAAHLAGLEDGPDGSTALASHPFARVAVHAGQTDVEYRVATAPTMTDAENLQAEAAEDATALTETAGRLQLEDGLHQELRVARQLMQGTFGTVRGELSVFDDSLDHPVLQGAVSGGEAAVDSDNVLYDPGTGTIALSGRGYNHGGVMAMLHDQLSPDTWITLRYAMGEAVTMSSGAVGTNLEQAADNQVAPMASIEGGTRIAKTGTVVSASYRWQPLDTLTPVTPFVREVPDAYLGVSFQQPLHVADNNRLEAIVDVRNLLAQGYRPFLSQDGTVVYFAQAQRCIAAGLQFSF